MFAAALAKGGHKVVATHIHLGAAQIARSRTRPKISEHIEPIERAIVPALDDKTRTELIQDHTARQKSTGEFRPAPHNLPRTAASCHRVCLIHERVIKK